MANNSKIAKIVRGLVDQGKLIPSEALTIAEAVDMFSRSGPKGNPSPGVRIAKKLIMDFTLPVNQHLAAEGAIPGCPVMENPQL